MINGAHHSSMSSTHKSWTIYSYILPVTGETTFLGMPSTCNPLYFYHEKWPLTNLSLYEMHRDVWIRILNCPTTPEKGSRPVRVCSRCHSDVGAQSYQLACGHSYHPDCFDTAYVMYTVLAQRPLRCLSCKDPVDMTCDVVKLV